MTAEKIIEMEQCDGCLKHFDNQELQTCGECSDCLCEQCIDEHMAGHEDEHEIEDEEDNE